MGKADSRWCRVRGLGGLILAASVCGCAAPAIAQCGDGWLTLPAVPNQWGAQMAVGSFDADGAGPQLPLLLLGGSFGSSPGNLHYLAATNGVAWQTYAGLSQSPRVITEWNGKLVAGGTIFMLGAPNGACGVWENGAWTSLGLGNGNVSALVEFEGDLIAAGTIVVPSGSGFSRVARWNGTQWVGMGGASTEVVALVKHNGELYASGFSGTWGPGQFGRIARWTGSQWVVVEAAGGGPVTSLASAHGSLYAAGTTFFYGGFGPVARLSGSTWSTVPDLPGGSVLTLTSRGDDLYVGGTFSFAGNQTALNVARFDGVSWHPLPFGTTPGVQGTVRDSVEWRDGVVFFGESLFLPGRTPSPVLHWGNRPRACVADMDCDLDIDSDDVNLFFAAWDQGGGEADVDGDGDADSDDVVLYFAVWESGC